MSPPKNLFPFSLISAESHAVVHFPPCAAKLGPTCKYKNTKCINNARIDSMNSQTQRFRTSCQTRSPQAPDLMWQCFKLFSPLNNENFSELNIVKKNLLY